MNTRRWRLPMLAALLLSITFWGWPFLASPGHASTAQVCPPVASTQRFTFVYGAVTLNSTAAPVGAIVEARSPRGDTVGCAVVETTGLYPLMYIFGEERVGGQTMPGMRTNEAVAFYINGILATQSPAFTWVNSWQSTRVDLAATGSVAPPIAAFSANPTAGVSPLSVQFTDGSTGTILARAWTFGDGATSTALSPSHTYTTPGVYTVTLTATGPESGDTETKTNYITVAHPPPVAAFSASPTAGTAPLAVQFTDTATGAITARAWSFGDSGTSTAQNPSHNYATAGVYTVTLTVSGPGGSNTKTRASYIIVTQSTYPPSSPAANFTASPTAGTAPLAVQFTDISTGTITAHAWSFGDGGTSTAQNPSYNYATAGVYTVTLTVSGPGGSNTKTRAGYITVTENTEPPQPIASFTASPTAGEAPLAVQFTDASTGVVTGWQWNFGDGQTSTAQYPAHTYNVAGSYTVTLTASGPGGSDGETKTAYITVSSTAPDAPVAAFGANPMTGTAPLIVQFTDVSTGTITAHAWSFGDGGTSTAQNPSYSYSTAGVYTVTLTVSGPGGSDTKTRASYISVTPNIEPPSRPVAAFTATPEQGTAPLVVQFTDASTGVVTAWVWSFGDGAQSNEQSPAHTYEAAGAYTATLSVSGPGGWHSAARALRVAPPAPAFTADPPVAGGLTVPFAFTPPPGVTHWLWEFGDGQTSTERNPVHTYAAAGDYTVQLTVYGAGGLSASVELAVQVRDVEQSLPDFNLYLPAVQR